jgi:hypothetical protein
MSSTPTIACRACKQSITSSSGRNTHTENISKRLHRKLHNTLKVKQQEWV